MATIEHSALTTGELHEPKGIATATSGEVYKANGVGSGSWSPILGGIDTTAAGTVYVADGAGSGSWQFIPNGFCYYSSPAGTSISGGLGFTVVSPISTTAGVMREVFHDGNSKLTYTGTQSTTLKVSAHLSGQCSTDTIDMAIMVGGIPFFYTSTSTNGNNAVFGLNTFGQVVVQPNTDIQIAVQSASNDILVENINLYAEGRI